MEAGAWPPEESLHSLAERAVEAALDALPGDAPKAGAVLSILFTDDSRMRALNARWRGQDKPTNVLSFPPAPALKADPPPIGDIALAAETVAHEAQLAEIPLEDHTAHLIIHGFFHLLGYDHEVEADAEAMENLERAALSRMGIADPTAAARRQ